MKTLRNRQNPVFGHKPSLKSSIWKKLSKKIQLLVFKEDVLSYSIIVRTLGHPLTACRATSCSLTTSFSPRSWGAITMKDTFISCQATSRSLNTISIQKGIQKEQREKHFRFSTFAVLLSLVFALFVCGYSNAADQQNADKSTSTADLLRQDVLRFVGPVTDRDVNNVTIPGDSFLVRLNRKTTTQNNEIPVTYGMLVRGVDPAEQALLQDAKDGKWDKFDLFRAALVVEGIRDENKFRQFENRLDAILAKINSSTTNKAELTRELFEALHRELLTEKYDIDCTNLGRVLETGHFNCVSATVLFNVLGEKAGLDVVALEMPGHALSRVKFDGQSMNLETTAPNWFSLQTEAARTQATVHYVARPIPAPALPAKGNQNGEVATIESAAELNDLSKKLREITPVQLIATIYYNQGVDFLNQERFAESAMANIKALHLDPASETAWGNLLATINNWSIKLATESKRYDLAATLLDQGVFLDPNYDKFRANQLHVYYHWIHELALEGRIADAQTVFTIADQRLPNDPDLRNLMQSIAKK